MSVINVSNLISTHGLTSEVHYLIELENHLGPYTALGLIRHFGLRKKAEQLQVVCLHFFVDNRYYAKVLVFKSIQIFFSGQ